MKEFWKILKRYAWPYKGWLGGSVVLNILSAVFNIFSFSLLIPILKILFNISEMQYEFIPWDTPGGDFTNIAVNNLYYFVTGLMQQWGASKVLLVLCLALSVITAVKTACYFGASAVMVPIRTGIVKDLRMDLYRKIVSLPLGYFSQERKGDIIARMSGDVQELPGHADQKSYPDHILYRGAHCHILATDCVRDSFRSSDALADGPYRP